MQSLEAMESILAGAGYMGVCLFFVLSGFILAYNYTTPDLRFTHGARRFWIARWSRVYPVYLAGLLLAIVPTFAWGGCSSIKLACGLGDRGLTISSSLTLLQAWLPNVPVRWNQPGWSLSVEAAFYALFPFIVLPLMRMSSRRCLLSVGALWLCGAMLDVAYAQIVQPHTAPGNVAWLQFMMFNPLVHLQGFLMGIVVCRSFVTYRQRGRAGKRVAGISNDVVLMSVVSLFVLILFSGQAPFVFLHSGFLDPLFALLIYVLATGEGSIATALSSPTLILLGEASYGIYIFHVPVADWLLHGITSYGMTALYPAGHLARFLLVYVAAVVALSIASFALLEQPARRFIRRAFSGN
jgi:peptidoglycan/LPS O-acetylase OafA/YrhL